MASTSVSLGGHFSGFIAEQVEAGHYKNASDVMRAALRLLEEHEERRAALRQAIAQGEASGYVEAFDPTGFRDQLRKKHGVGG